MEGHCFVEHNDSTSMCSLINLPKIQKNIGKNTELFSSVRGFFFERGCTKS